MTSIILINPQQAMASWNLIFAEQVKPLTFAGHKLRMTIKRETRRDGQNARFHAMISDIAEQIGGDLADKDDAKRILLSAFRFDTFKDYPDEWAKFGDVRIGRGLRGETVLMGNQTRDLSVKLAAVFIEWLESFGVENNIRFKAPKSWEI